MCPICSGLLIPLSHCRWCTLQGESRGVRWMASRHGQPWMAWLIIADGLTIQWWQIDHAHDLLSAFRSCNSSFVNSHDQELYQLWLFTPSYAGYGWSWFTQQWSTYYEFVQQLMMPHSPFLCLTHRMLTIDHLWFSARGRNSPLGAEAHPTYAAGRAKGERAPGWLPGELSPPGNGTSGWFSVAFFLWLMELITGNLPRLLDYEWLTADYAWLRDYEWLMELTLTNGYHIYLSFLFYEISGYCKILNQGVKIREKGVTMRIH